MRLSRLTCATAMLALLTACGEEAPPSSDSRAATGEVLEGTISDAMLPLDQVRSQPPLVAPRPSSTGADDANEGEEPEAVEEGGAVPGEDEAAVESAETPAVAPRQPPPQPLP